MKKLGYLVALYPIGFIDSVIALRISLLLLLLSVVINRRLSLVDWLLLGLLGITAYSWLTVGGYERSFISPQISSYYVFLFSLRFFYVCRDDLLNFITNLPLFHYLLLCVVYLVVQVKVGYTYEVGVLEAFMLIRLALQPRQRGLMLAMLLAYLALMFLISTRTTPLGIALLVAGCCLLKPPKPVLKAVVVGVILLTPVAGFFLMGLDLSASMADVDDNAEIRLEMLKGASSMIGVSEFLHGVGFGGPYRDVSFKYAFWHPLLDTRFLAHQVSNHNSLFDVFFRFGIFVYALFVVVFLRVIWLDKTTNHYVYALLFVTLFSLSVNAYLDSTRLSHAFAAFIIGLMLLIPRRTLRHQRAPSAAVVRAGSRAADVAKSLG